MTTTRTPRRRAQAGRKLRAVCPRCRRWIAAGEWIKPAPGRGLVFAHAEKCPEVNA